jgi:hypothetical protein
MFKILTHISIIMVLVAPSIATAASNERSSVRHRLSLLYSDIALSAASIVELAVHPVAKNLVIDSDDSTVLAALEKFRDRAVFMEGKSIELTADDVAAAQMKIEKYGNQCDIAESYTDIFERYCLHPPHVGLYQKYTSALLDFTR